MEQQKEYLIKLLQSESSHDTFNSVVERFPKEHINGHMPGVLYTPWHLIEHIRIAQRDNIDYVIGKDYKPLAWPKEYWPGEKKQATIEMWNQTVKTYNDDLATFLKLIETRDLLEILPTTKSANVFKQVLIVADHTAYHVGELSLMKSFFKAA